MIYVLEQYYEAIKEVVLQKTENMIKLYTFDEMGALFNQILANEVERSSVSYPFVVLKCSENYVADKREYQYEDQGETQTQMIDFINSFPCELKVELVAYAENIQDLISTEEYLTALANEETTIVLNDKTPSRRVRFTISKDNDVDIVRDSADNATLGKRLCFANVTFKAKDCVIFSKEYHPAEIALDKKVQKELLNQVVIAIPYAYSLSAKLASMRPDWYTPKRVEISPDLSEGVANYLRKINEDYERTQKRVPGEEESKLAQEEGDLWKNIKKILSELITDYKDEDYRRALIFSNYGYLNEYLSEMNEHDCDIKKAIELFNKRKDDFDKKRKEKEEEERAKKQEEEDKKAAEEKREKLLQSKGDPTLNRFTDPIVNFFKDLFKGDNIHIFGGSTLMEWYKYDSADVPLPALVIDADSNYTFEKKVFNNCDAEGNQKVYYFNANAMPIYYSVLPKIFAEKEDELNTIEKKIRDAFTEEKVIKVPDYYLQGEFNQLKLKIDSSIAPTNQSIANHTDNGIKIYNQRNIKFLRPENVYPYKKVSVEDVEFNQRLQFRLVQQLQFVTLMHSFLTDRATKELNYTYKNMFSQKSTLGSLWSSYEGLFKSAEYREVSNCIKNRQPINREKFDKVFEKITSVYPYLYDRTMQGWSIEQIKEEILKAAKPYQERIDELVGLLNIPKTLRTKRGNEYSAKDNAALTSYIHSMVNDVFKTTDLAIADYRKQLNETEDKKEAERRARAEAAQYEQSYSHESSGGGILETAIGTAIGTHGIKKELHKANKRATGLPDLIGSAGCARGKKINGFTVNGCDMRCPLYRECSRGRGW